ncbi:hypothetical protein IFR05_007998 [Cadophora sp. M221]|nr:hypothetical protein IFR05_007998 [Cadophora sp. M221]
MLPDDSRGGGKKSTEQVPTLTVSNDVAKKLLKAAREYANLQRNLIRGGLEAETLAVLVNDDPDPVPELEQALDVTGQQSEAEASTQTNSLSSLDP